MPDSELHRNPRPVRIPRKESVRLHRIRLLSRILDNSIPLPGGYRVGLDPIIGMFPYLGEMATSALSFYLLYEAARLGLPKRVLGKMVRNIMVDSLAGSVPVLGDLFDFFWKSNARNIQLIESAYHPGLQERPSGTIAVWVWGLFLLFLAIVIGFSVVIFTLITRLFQAIF